MLRVNHNIFQIEQGKPLIKGFIDESTTEWIEPKPVEKQNGSQAVPVGVFGFMKLHMDILLGQFGTVVTGVRFKFDKEAQAISLEIQTTPINWPEEDATLISLAPAESEWISETRHSSPREPVVLVNPGDPLSQRGPAMPDSVLNSFVEFTTSSYEADLAQTVIPLFDTQPVFYYEDRRWLRGAGLMHKGKPGFVTPLIVPASPHAVALYYPSPPL
jgi:hypothetical protein